MDTHVPPPKIGLPRMTADERALFDRTVQRGFRRYAEFGMGGSTLVAVRADFERIVSVDSDGAWVGAIRTHEEIAPAVASGRARILHADIGKVGAWGAPADKSLIQQWPQYISKMWAEWSALEASPDLIFIDGRFRTACCLSVALLYRCSPPESVAPTVLIHDVHPKRPVYLRAFKYFDIVETTDTLYVLKPKREPDSQGLLAELLELQFDTK